MFARFCTNNRKPRWRRFISCAVLGLYLLALVAAPALHWHLFDHSAVSYSEHSSSDSNSTPVSEDTCPLCQFVRAAIPYFVDAEPFQVQTDTVAEAYFTVSNPLVAYVTVLPPCRAPPSRLMPMHRFCSTKR